MDYNKIGEYIQSKRKALGMTQADLGDKLGVSSKAVSKWECGVALPDVSLFSGLCEMLNIEVSELLEGKDKEKIPISKKKNIAIISLSILSIVLLILSLVFGVYFIKNYDTVHVYDIKSSDERFTVDGKFISINKTNYLSVNNIALRKDDGSRAHYIGYDLYFKDRIVYQKEELDSIENNTEQLPITLQDYMRNISIFVTVNSQWTYSEEKKTSDLWIRIKYLEGEDVVKHMDIYFSIKKIW